MLFRTLYNFVFSSPVTVAASVIIVACVSILAVNISSNLEATSDFEIEATSDSRSGNVSEKMKKQSPVSFSNDKDSVKQNLIRSTNAVAPKRTITNTNRKMGLEKSSDKYNDNEQYFVEDLNTNSDSPSVNNRNKPSIFNYSNVGSSSNAAKSPSASSSFTSNTAATESSAGASDPETSTPVGEPESEPEPEKKCDDYPVSLKYEVPITADRTDSVSCVPIVANGRPCMCTHRIVDGDNITNWVEDNCGNVEKNSNLLCN